MTENRQGKLKLSRMEGSILWMLEEAGEENLPTIINTLKSSSLVQPNSSVLDEVKTAILGLSNLGLITLTWEPVSPNEQYVDIPQEQIKAMMFHRFLDYDQKDERWSWRNDDTAPRIITVVLTEQGTKALKR